MVHPTPLLGRRHGLACLLGCRLQVYHSLLAVVEAPPGRRRAVECLHGLPPRCEWPPHITSWHHSPGLSEHPLLGDVAASPGPVLALDVVANSCQLACGLHDGGSDAYEAHMLVVQQGVIGDAGHVPALQLTWSLAQCSCGSDVLPVVSDPAALQMRQHPAVAASDCLFICW